MKLPDGDGHAGNDTREQSRTPGAERQLEAPGERNPRWLRRPRRQLVVECERPFADIHRDCCALREGERGRPLEVCALACRAPDSGHS